MQFSFGIMLLIGLAASAPTLPEDTTIVTSRVFPDCSTNYTSQHDIFSLTLPITKNGSYLNVDKDILNPHVKLFFIEADVNDNGEKDYKGLYVLIDNKATKLLDHGTDVTTAIDPYAAVYFSANDGLYVYNEQERKAEKYGTITNSIINVEKVNGSDIFYILTKTNKLYKVINNGQKKIKIHNVKNVQKILLDFSNNLFYYGPDKKLYVMNANGVKKIEGLPEHPTRVDMFKPVLQIVNGVFFISDNKTYLIYGNGTKSTDEDTKLYQFQVIPTSCAMEGMLVQYYAYDKKICMYNTIEVWTRKISQYISKIISNIELAPKSFDDIYNSVAEL